MTWTPSSAGRQRSGAWSKLCPPVRTSNADLGQVTQLLPCLTVLSIRWGTEHTASQGLGPGRLLQGQAGAHCGAAARLALFRALLSQLGSRCC